MSKITRRTLLAGASIGLISSRAWAQTPSEVKVGLLVPVSGLYARPGTVMREGAEMAVMRAFSLHAVVLPEPVLLPAG